jgi:hypothetical protein
LGTVKAIGELPYCYNESGLNEFITENTKYIKYTKTVHALNFLHRDWMLDARSEKQRLNEFPHLPIGVPSNLFKLVRIFVTDLKI